MKDETKKYVAGGFVGVLFGIQYFYGNLPNVTNTIVLVQDSIPVSEDISVDSATILSSTTLNIDTEVVSMNQDRLY